MKLNQEATPITLSVKTLYKGNPTPIKEGADGRLP